jgi:hypothetical protein
MSATFLEALIDVHGSITGIGCGADVVLNKY